MIRYPNQKQVKTVKCKSGKNNKYSIVNIDAMSQAMIDLTDKAFKLWCYLNKNQDNYIYFLSSVDALSFGISNDSAYDRSVKELIEKGYLKKIEGTQNDYIFFESKLIYSE